MQNCAIEPTTEGIFWPNSSLSNTLSVTEIDIMDVMNAYNTSKKASK